jgi:hypothetical protein
VAAARAGLEGLRGIDRDPEALRIARRALRLCGARAAFKCADSLTFSPRRPADLLVSNPPYGHVTSARERAALLRAYPALRGGEIDRYAVFLLRALDLVRPGGTAALLVPDTWMFLSRAGSLREAVLNRAEIAAVVDLGKPFAAAKDTRVHAVVLRNRSITGTQSPTFVGRKSVLCPDFSELAPVERTELEQSARHGWFIYRTRAERALCEAMERASVPLGTACEVGYGMRTGDNARHVARRPPGPKEIGLVGGEDIVPFALRWRPKTLTDPQPLADLAARQISRPRVAIQRIRTNSAAPWARWLEAAPVPPGLVCLDSLSTLAAPDELLQALLALVSSVALNRFHRLRTTDVNVKPSALRNLPVPRALLAKPGPLAALARKRAAGADLDRAIDAQVYALFGLSRELVHACEQGFWSERFSEEIQRLEGAMSDPCAMVARKEESA